MPISNINVGMRIARLRTERKMTQQQLAFALSVSHQAVSKWETGAALPDLETLLNMSKLFGVTVEQLLEGTAGVEERRREKVNDSYLDTQLMWDGLKEAADRAVQTTKTIGNALMKHVNRVIDDANSMVNDSADNDDDGTEDSIVTDVECGKNEIGIAEDGVNMNSISDNTRRLSPEALLQLSPFMSREKVSSVLLSYEESIPVMTLVKLAPYVTQDALAKLILSLNKDDISMNTVTSLAPFLKQDVLFKLILQNPDKLDYTMLKKFAPFLKKGMVDTLVDVVSGIRKTVNSDAVADFAEKTRRGVESIFNRIAEAVTSTTENSETPGAVEEQPADGEESEDTAKEAAEESAVLPEDRLPPETLNEADRRSIHALENRSWDWIRMNISEIASGKVLEEVVLTAAKELDTEEARDILLNAAPYMDSKTFNSLIEKLAEAGLWARICDLSPLMDVESAGNILKKACGGGKAALDAVRLYASKASREVWNSVSSNAISEGNWELVNALTENIKAD